MKNLSTKQLVKMAMYLALYMAVDFISSRFIQMPQGGSLGLGAVVLLIATFDLGTVKGLVIAILSVFVSYLYTTLYFVRFDQFLIDYILAYGAYGLGVILSFSKPKDGLYPIYGLVLAAVLTNALRLAAHVFSGVVYYETDLVGSWTYNSSYMIPTLIASAVLLPILYKALTPVLKKF